MKLYYDPVSTVCRPVMLFAAEHDIALDYEFVSLFEGQHLDGAYAALNPSQTVPLLVDGDLTLAESSAILQYLADKAGSPAYPADLKARARVNADLAWVKGNLYKEFGMGVYSQLLPQYALSDPAAQAEMVARCFARADRWLRVLNDHMIASRRFIGGDQITLADYMGVGVVASGDLVGFDFSPYPNVKRWLDTIRSRPHWAAVDVAFQGWLSAIRQKAA